MSSLLNILVIFCLIWSIHIIGLQVAVWSHVGGENRSHQGQNYGQETFHHQSRSGRRHNPEAEKLRGCRGGRHQRYRQQGEGLEDQDHHSPEHWEGQSQWCIVVVVVSQLWVGFVLHTPPDIPPAMNKHDCVDFSCGNSLISLTH